MIIKKYLLLMIGLSFLANNNVVAKEPNWTSYQVVLQHIKPDIRNGITFVQVDYNALNATGSLNKAYQVLSSFDSGQLRILVIMNTDSGHREHFPCPRIGFRLFLP